MEPMASALVPDVHTIALMLLRWIHFMAGITWIGLLYFFNLVNGPFQKTLDAVAKKQVVPSLMPRALWWFRWGAMITFLSGYTYIIWKNWIASDAGMRGAGGLMTSTWGLWISLGALLGTIMWFNVWFIIWPAQKRIIAWVKAGEAPPQMAGIARQALIASRANTYLSVPLLFSMGGASHFPSMNVGTVALVFAISIAIVYTFINVSTKVAAR